MTTIRSEQRFPFFLLLIPLVLPLQSRLVNFDIQTNTKYAVLPPPPLLPVVLTVRSLVHKTTAIAALPTLPFVGFAGQWISGGELQRQRASRICDRFTPKLQAYIGDVGSHLRGVFYNKLCILLLLFGQATPRAVLLCDDVQGLIPCYKRRLWVAVRDIEDYK